MGGGGTRVEYRAPEIPRDNSFQQYLQYQQERESAAERRAAQEKADAAVQMNQAIAGFTNYAVASYQLQSNQLLTNLQYELTGTENRLAVERRRYNQAVQAYNQKVQSFPNSLVANMFGFEKREFFR